MLLARFFKIFSIVIIFFVPGTLMAKPEIYKYAINLESSEKKSSTSLDLNKYKLKQQYKLFQSKVNLGRNKSFYRLRIGFFKSKKEAARVSRKFKSKYPKLWIDKINKQDRKILVSWLASNKKPSKKQSVTTNNFASKEKKAKRLMVRAKNAMMNKKYRLAVGLYRKVIRLNSSSHHQEAMEFLGLAREKNGQLIHARAEYRLYLKKYPTGDDSRRVRQRLISLKTILLKPRRKLKKRKSKLSEWQKFGSVLQFYRQDVFSSNQVETSNETLSTNINYIARKRGESLNIKSQFNASHLEYINNPTRTGKGRINTLFVDVADKNNSKSIRLGRQTQTKGGVLGKMDGVLLGYRINPKWKLNLVSGLPVQTSTSNLPQKHRPFVGISADISKITKYWDLNIYTINQKVDSIIDRNAVGGEIRYLKGKQNHFALIDYDTYFSELNTFFYVGNWRFDNNAAVVLTLNHRNSPILTTTNATQGQAGKSIETLLETYTENELKQFAKDRTTKYNSSAISTSIPLSDKWTFAADATVSNLSSAPASAGVVAIEGTGNEFFYGAQFIGYNVFSAQETTRYQVRFDDTKTFKRTRYTVSSRFRLKNKKWRLRPALTIESRINKKGGTTSKIIPKIKVDYKLKRKLKLELDVGYEAAKTTSPVAITENNYYLSLGFIWDF